jgi:hypothetical protein
MCTKRYSEKVNVSDHLGDLLEDLRILLKWILESEGEERIQLSQYRVKLRVSKFRFNKSNHDFNHRIICLS